MSNQNQCGHCRVKSIITDYPVGTKSQHWECPDCNTRFWPESIDMHKIRLRDMFAAKAMQGIIASGKDVKYYGLTSTQQLDVIAYKIADAMLAERSKQI